MMTNQKNTSNKGLWVMQKLNSQQLVVLALLMGLDLALGRLTIGTNLIKVGVVFIAMALIGKWYGPIWSVLVAALLDVVNITIVNPNGVFFIGFTISAMVTGVIYGVSYYQRDHVNWVRVAISEALVVLIVDVGMHTVWLFMMYSHVHNIDTFMALIAPRSLKSLIVYPIQVAILHVVLNNAVVKQLTQKIFK